MYVLPTVLLLLITLTHSNEQGYCSSAEESCKMASFRVLLAGATGETGKVLLQNLLEDTRIAKVTTIGRRESTVTHEKLAHRVVDFDAGLPEEVFSEQDVAMCTLGTTRGKSGKEGFLKVDRDYILDFATKSKAADIKQFHLLSSSGASSQSSFLYLHTKGIVDDQVQEMGFERAVIYRPNVLLCDRQESRWGERIARSILSWADTGRRMSIYVTDVAKVMANSVSDSQPGNTILSNQDIIALAKPKEGQ